jgi:putative ABC transport system permease protein
VDYYWKLSVGALRRNPGFTALIVLIIALGIGASTTMLVVLHSLNADPVPGKGGRLFHPQLQPSVAGRPPAQGVLPASLMWPDALNLLAANKAIRQAITIEGQVTLMPSQGIAHARMAKAMFAGRDMFTMFDAKFAAGAPWDATEEANSAHVAVISGDLARQAFGTVAAVGRSLRLGDVDFQVVGVLGNWAPRPRFFDLSGGAFSAAEQVYLPLTTARALSLEPGSSPECWGDGMPDMDKLELAPCTWVELWVELPTAASREIYLNFLRAYWLRQKAAGRFYGDAQVALPSLSEWLETGRVVPNAARLQAAIAYCFLLICIFNAAGLLMVMFMRRKRELGLRRALGATRRQIFLQLLAETAGIGLASVAFGAGVTWGLLHYVRLRPEAYYAHVEVDSTIVLLGIALTLLATLAATLVPAWQVTRGAPFVMLKS